MAFLIQGNGLQVYGAFEHTKFCLESDCLFNQILIDISRTLFFGSKEEKNIHFENWSNETKIEEVERYTQGRPTSANLKFILGPIPFVDVEPDPEILFSLYRDPCMSYIDKEGQLCGLAFYFLKNDPTKWMISLVKNPNKKLETMEIFVLSNMAPEPSDPNMKVLEVSDANIFLKQIKHPILTSFVNKILYKNKLNPKAECIQLLIQNVTDSFVENSALMEIFQKRMDEFLNNRYIDLFIQYEMIGIKGHIFPTPQQLVDCLDPTSQLSQLLENFILKGDGDKEKLGLIIKSNATNPDEFYYQSKIEQIDPRDKKAYELVREDSSKAKDFRLMLEFIRPVDKLQEGLLDWIQQNINTDLLVIEETPLVKGPFEHLIDPLFLIRHLRKSNVLDEHVACLKNPKFYQAALKIETTCNDLSKYLRKNNPEKLNNFEAQIDNFRRNLYQVVFDEITATDEKKDKNLNSFRNKIIEAEREMKAVLEVDKHPIVRNILMVLVNALTMVFTLTGANFYHYHKTDDFLLFRRPKSSENLQVMNEELISMMKSEA